MTNPARDPKTGRFVKQADLHRVPPSEPELFSVVWGPELCSTFDCTRPAIGTWPVGNLLHHYCAEHTPGWLRTPPPVQMRRLSLWERVRLWVGLTVRVR